MLYTYSFATLADSKCTLVVTNKAPHETASAYLLTMAKSN